MGCAGAGGFYLALEMLSCLHRFIGVSDIASVRFSLPAQLLEPTPNLGKQSAPIVKPCAKVMGT